MKVIIDRFEGEFAVVETEDKMFVNLPKRFVPTGASEGSVISIEIDNYETEKRKERITGLMSDVWNT